MFISFSLSRQEWEKVNVSWLQEGSLVEYEQKKTFHFDETLSVGSEDDLITVPNVPMIVS